jgi:hypothetical protein
VYNPAIGFLLFRLYVLLGGNRRRTWATIVTFVICGMCHDLIVMAINGQWCVIFTFAFAMFALLTLLSFRFQSLLRQVHWPAIANIVMSAGLIAGTLHVAASLNSALHGW